MAKIIIYTQAQKVYSVLPMNLYNIKGVQINRIDRLTELLYYSQFQKGLQRIPSLCLSTPYLTRLQCFNSTGSDGLSWCRHRERSLRPIDSLCVIFLSRTSKNVRVLYTVSAYMKNQTRLVLLNVCCKAVIIG